MNFTEKATIPEACIDCKEECSECDNALDRWEIDPINKLQIMKKVKMKAINKLIEEIVAIDLELAEMEGREKK